MRIFPLIEYNVKGEFKFLVTKDNDSHTGDYETYGSFIIECEGNRNETVWKQVKGQPQIVHVGQYFVKPFNYTISTTESSKLIYHGRVDEIDDESEDLVGSYEGHIINVKDIIGKEYTHIFPGVNNEHQVEISIKLT